MTEQVVPVRLFRYKSLPASWTACSIDRLSTDCLHHRPPALIDRLLHGLPAPQTTCSIVIKGCIS